MTLLDETFNVAPEFFYEYLDGVIEKIRAALILLLPSEFCLVPVPFSKPDIHQDKENGLWYESNQDVFRERIKQFDIILEKDPIGHILVEHRKTDSLRVRIFTYAGKIEKGPSGKLYPDEGPKILAQVAKDLCRIEPGHPLQLAQSEKPQSVLEGVEAKITAIEQACITWAGRDSFTYDNVEEFLVTLRDENLYLSKDQFKRALRDCEKKGLIRKVNGRFRSL